MECSEDITKSLPDENVVFAQWKSAPADEKVKYLPRLLRLLRAHAFAVCWIKLKENRPDIVNQAVWRVLSRKDEFEGKSSFSTWFQAIVQNLCTDVHRTNVRKAEVTIEGLNLPATKSGVEAKIELEQLSKGLKDRQKLLVKLKLKGLNDAEIGRVLGINELAVRHSWTRTKEKIRKKAGVELSV